METASHALVWKIDQKGPKGFRLAELHHFYSILVLVQVENPTYLASQRSLQPLEMLQILLLYFHPTRMPMVGFNSWVLWMRYLPIVQKVSLVIGATHARYCISAQKREVLGASRACVGNDFFMMSINVWYTCLQLQWEEVLVLFGLSTRQLKWSDLESKICISKISSSTLAEWKQKSNRPSPAQPKVRGHANDHKAMHSIVESILAEGADWSMTPLTYGAVESTFWDMFGGGKFSEGRLALLGPLISWGVLVQ